ncbi:endonuclease V [Pseudonocardia sp. WMMC193]|uniref:endonuclease V n=1 Tax=Pseudonocardia sp. WMMC193 TaxID=2911965 RepID=UPI001F0115A3|nr:endonuclease V [Pseudonocardia sp. WMMC193]MCF7551244.1 endonuclease V [Pseudonocardia sp. WMMC193]
MIIAVDVQHRDDGATGAVVGFGEWTDGAAVFEAVHETAMAPHAYEPGAFFKRELPILLDLAAAARARGRVDTVVVDGHAWLDGGRPGLGAHLHRALGGPVVVGVAKTAFRNSGAAEVVRGGSVRPLYVTSAGVDKEVACAAVAAMHGVHRIPTLLAHVDRLARGIALPRRTE